MAERYSRIFTLPPNLYADDAPVIIVAGVLLKDSQTGSRLAQLKIQNIDKRTITYMKLHFMLMDASGRIIKDHYHIFDKMSMAENDFYGTRTPVVLPVPSVCSYTISILEIEFDNDTQWRSDELWHALDDNTDVGVLKKERDFRIQLLLEKEAYDREIAEAEAKAAREAEEVKRIAEEKQKKAKQRKYKVIAISVLAVFFLAGIFGYFTWRASPQYMVKQVIDHIEREDFGAASILLREAEYELTEKDIRSANKSAIYNYAKYLSRVRSFSDAIAIYKLIPDYADSMVIVNEMESMLDKYVGEYECISNKTTRANGEVETGILESNIYITGLSYNISRSTEITMLISSDGYNKLGAFGFYTQYGNEDVLESYHKSDGILLGYEFSPDGKTITYIYHIDAFQTIETVWQKIS